MTDLSKLSDEELASALRQALDAEARGQMSHPFAEDPVDKYTAEARRQGPLKNALATAGGNMYGAYLGLTGQDDPEHEAAMAGLRSAPGSMIGDIAGGGAVYLPSMLPQTAPLRILAATGTAFGSTPGNVSDRIGAATVTGLGAGIGEAVPYAYKLGKALQAPTTAKGRDKLIGKMLASGVEPGRIDEVLNNLRTGSPLLPGSMPTAAEVANSGHIAAAQRWAAQANPDQYAWVGQQNEAARRDALSGIAGTPAEREAATQARDQAAEVLYGQARTADRQRVDALRQQANATRNLNTSGIGGPGNVPIPLDPRIAALADNPVIKAAVRDAETLAKTKGEQIGNPLETLDGLHYVKMALDERLSGKQPTGGLAKLSDAAVKATKGKLLAAIEGTPNQPGISPLYGAARETFRDMSKPINQMDVGQYLYDKLVSGLGKERGATFADQLKSADDMVRRVTGGRQTLEQVMTPDQLNTLYAIRDDLMRKTAANDLGRGVGSNTFQNLAMENLSREAGIPSMLSAVSRFIPSANTVAAGLKTAASTATQGYEQQMRNRLADVLLNPQLTAKVMEAANDPGKFAKLLQTIPNPTTRQLIVDAYRFGQRSVPAGAGIGLANASNR